MDTTFQARDVAQFVSGWTFFDPSPLLLRRTLPLAESARLDAQGRNLAERLFTLRNSPTGRPAFDRIVSAVQSILGLPLDIEPRESENRYYFAQMESGGKFSVHQIGTSSGTLRVLALMTALHEDSAGGLVGIEEPENNIHPTALEGFAEHLLDASGRMQLLVTTHSPILLNHLPDPSGKCVVRRFEVQGTEVVREAKPQGVVRALEASGFGLGEFYETKGFGA